MTRIFLCVCLLFVVIEGSYLVFEKSPDVIKTFFTPTLNLRCSLHLHDANDSSSPENAVYVTSLVITRDGGKQVASVLPFGSPNGFLDLQKLNVTGHVSHMSNEQGLISLTWQNPMSDQAGNYTCEVNALTKAGKNMVYHQTMSVEVGKPDMDDLIEHVHLVELKNQELEAKLDQMTTGGVTSGNLSHVEGGTIHCPGQDKSHTVHQSFTSSYPTPPLVHLGVTSFLSNGSIHGGSTMIGHYVTLSDVSHDSFTVSCVETKAPYNFNYIVVIDWISLPH